MPAGGVLMALEEHFQSLSSRSQRLAGLIGERPSLRDLRSLVGGVRGVAPRTGALIGAKLPVAIA